MIVGIDFGTSYSSVSIKDGSTVITLEQDLLHEKDSLGIPTVFMYDGSEYYFGSSWIKHVKNYADVIFNVKSLTRSSPDGFEKTVTSGNKIFKLREIVKLFLEFLLDETLHRAKKIGLKTPYLEAITITSPIGIDDNVRSEEYNRTMREIVSEILPDFDKTRIFVIEEPLAGAFSNFKNVSKINQSENLLVFDLGGGTLDLALVTHHQGNVDSYQVRATGGDLHLGGNNWDEALTKALEKELNIPKDRNDKEKYEFDNEIINAKIALSDQDYVFFNFIDSNGKEYSKEISLAYFNYQTKDLMNRALDQVSKLLTESKLKKQDVDRISLVGGSSRMRQVFTSISKYFPDLSTDKIEHFDVSNAISMGAAMYAEMKIHQEEMSWTDILHHSYGIDLKPRSDSEFEILYLLFKGEKLVNGEIKAKLDAGIRPESDGNRYVFFSVYESNITKDLVDAQGFYKMSKYERPTGLAVRVNVPIEYRGRATQYTIYPTICIDSNGILGIELYDERNRLLVSKIKNVKKRIIEF